MDINYKSIGVLRSPFNELVEMPIQPSVSASAPGYAEIFDEYIEGLKDLDGFSHVMLVYHFHRVSGYELLVTPYHDTKPHGVFATRAPARPNPIGISIVRLASIEGREVHFTNLDVLNGTPLLDIKPYVPAFDAPSRPRIGWLEGVSEEKLKTSLSDDRFA